MRDSLHRHCERAAQDGCGRPTFYFAAASPLLLVAVHCPGRDVVAVADQIRAVAKERLDTRLGELSPADLRAVEEGVREILELA